MTVQNTTQSTQPTHSDNRDSGSEGLTCPDAPYPGLRPFSENEGDIFVGRGEQVADLLLTLRDQRLVTVVGPSGCGKSSLVYAGLLPALRAGFLIHSRAGWRTAQFTPGNSPIDNLAAALVECEGLAIEADTDDDRCIWIDSVKETLRRGPLGLLEVLEDTPVRIGANLLILVDQFEEIFRHRRHDDEPEAFVRLLLETVRQAKKDPEELPVRVVLTMRSDFLGDCNRFPGLPEAINATQFLVPRLSRAQRDLAVSGPAHLFDGEVDKHLVNRLLNDMGDDPDQLPIAQHALMRMWTMAEARQSESDSSDGIKLTIDDYETAGGWRATLSNHANEVFDSLETDEHRRIAQVLFRCLTERETEDRYVRRPATFGELAQVAGLKHEHEKSLLREVIEQFSDPSCCFLTPRAGTELTANTVIDISHESLIRQWKELKVWAKAEADSAQDYLRLADAAARHKDGRKASLWTGRQLDDALEWRKKQQPTPEWAERYGGDLELSKEFLDKSISQRSRKHLQEKLFLAFAAIAIVMILLAVVIVVNSQRNVRNSLDAHFRDTIDCPDSLLLPDDMKRQRFRQLCDSSESAQDALEYSVFRADLNESFKGLAFAKIDADLIGHQLAKQTPDLKPAIESALADVVTYADFAKEYDTISRTLDRISWRIVFSNVLESGGCPVREYRRSLTRIHNELGKRLRNENSENPRVKSLLDRVKLNDYLQGSPELPDQHGQPANGLTAPGEVFWQAVIHVEQGARCQDFGDVSGARAHYAFARSRWEQSVDPAMLFASDAEDSLFLKMIRAQIDFNYVAAGRILGQMPQGADLERLRDAVEDFRSIAEASGFPALWNYTGKAYHLLGEALAASNSQEARDAYRNAMIAWERGTKPDLPRLADAACESGFYREALDYASEAMKDAPIELRSYVDGILSRTALRLGEEDCNEVRRLLKRSAGSNDPIAVRDAGLLLEEAHGFFKQAVEANDRLPEPDNSLRQYTAEVYSETRVRCPHFLYQGL